MQLPHASPVSERIEAKLKAALAPVELSVDNESHMHNVPKGSETHFRVTIVSSAFEGKSPVARHQLVYRALREEIAQGVHALAITSRTPAEWQALPEANASPECLGGSKA
jgi:BolA protein